MFTGIVEEKGYVRKIARTGVSGSLEIETSSLWEDAACGDSVAVNGVCLTISKKNRKTLSFDVLGETFSMTNLRFLKINDAVNLERSLKASARMGGHFVYGHIDGTRKILMIKASKNEGFVDIGIESRDSDYIVEKGSIAVDGISLTAGKILSDKVRIYLVPHTMKNTTLLNKKIGAPLNIEFDMLAKYIKKQSPSSRITPDFLKQAGFSR